MKKILFFLTLIAFSGNAQNLVVNPSFEQTTNGCAGFPFPAEGMKDLVNWDNISNNTPGDTCSTPDLFSTCNNSLPITNLGVPVNLLGSQCPRNGEKYAGIITYDATGSYREYLQGQLTTPLQAGQSYCVSFYISLADTVPFASNNIGVHFANTHQVWNAPCYGPFSPVPLTPQLNYTCVLTNTEWVKLEWNYVATGGEQYIIIGNFFNNGATTTTNTGGSLLNPFAYYYIEDVSVQAGNCCDAEILVAGNTDCENWSNGNYGLTSMTVCPDDGAFNLTVEDVLNAQTCSVPTAGTWSGNGITNATTGTFDPTVAGNGTHTITYTIACGTSTIDIQVVPCMEVCLETNGDFTVSGGTAPYTWQETVPPGTTPITNQTECTACGYTWAGFACINGFTPVTTCNSPGGLQNFTTGTTITPTTNFPIQVTDNSGATFLINSAGSLPACSVVSCPTLTTSITSQTNVNCFGQATGAATVSAGNGTAPYTYTWMPGSLNGATQTGLTAGNYTVNIVDDAGCPGTANVTITQPSAALSATVNTTPTGCGTSTGTATAVVSGGTTNYSFVWSNSASITSTATGLPAGPGSVTITDALGCQIVQNFSITTPGAITVTITAQTNVNCFGQSTGSATASASGGLAAYNYVWDSGLPTGATQNGLSANTYNVTAIDQNGCTGTASVTITQPSAALSAIVNTIPAACGTSNGQATAVVSGGTTNYSFVWSNSASTTATATGLPAGPGSVTITDALGCQIVENFAITTPGAPTLVISNVTGVDCANATNGGATVVASGGTAPLTYSWSPSGESTTTATGLHAGNNTITVTDNVGCSASEIVNIPSPPAIVITETITPTNCGEAIGQIAVNATGGTGTLTYTWTPNVGSGATISNLIGGTYDLTVEDDNGCTTTETYDVDVIGTLPVIASPTSIQIEAGDTIQLFASGATNYTWLPTTGLSCTDCPNPVASPTETTIYTVVGSDAFGCTGEATVAILIQTVCGDIFIPTIFSPNGDLNNDLQCVMGNCISTMKYSIYDRWGEKVFETEDQTECWDGTFRGKELNSGVFAFKFNATLVDGTFIEQSGNLTLVR